MYKTTELLDMLKAAYDLPSDYAVAKKIGYSRQGISNLRNKRSFLNDSDAMNVAELLELDPLIVIASCHAEREERQGNGQLVNFWQAIANKSSLRTTFA